MKKLKNLISWFSSLVTKKNKVKYEDIETEALLSQEVKKADFNVTNHKENNIKIKELICNFKEDVGLDIPNWNNEDINYFVSNSSLDRYSSNIIDEGKSGNDYYNFNKAIKRLELDSLNIFEGIERNYFEELERYEKELEDIVKFRHKTIEEIGLEGELKVQWELDLLDKDEYKIIHNILIPGHNGKTTQIDSIVISEYGIFVIETKKYNAIIVGDDESKYWTSYYKRPSYSKKIKNKAKIKKVYNPIRQNIGHILSLKKLLNEFENLTFHSIIAFDEVGELKVKTAFKVIYIKNLVSQIKKYKQEVMNKNLVEEIYNEILKYQLDNDVFLQYHAEYLNNIKKRERKYPDNNIKLDYLFTLCITPRIGAETINLIKNIYKKSDGIINSLDDLIELLNKCYSINPFITLPSIEKLELYYQSALKSIDDYMSRGILLTPYYNLNYPRNLMKNRDYPQIIFTKGNINALNNSKKIGILIGNSPTRYGSSCAHRLGEICANKDITIVSIVGVNYDLDALNGSLGNKGKVILVNPSRLTIDNMKINKEIYEKTLENNGCILSFTHEKVSKSSYKTLIFYKNFLEIIDKLILVETNLNNDIKIHIDEIYNGEFELAYVPQSKNNEMAGKIDPNEVIMNNLNAIKLSDSEVLDEFLS